MSESYDGALESEAVNAERVLDPAPQLLHAIVLEQVVKRDPNSR